MPNQDIITILFQNCGVVPYNPRYFSYTADGKNEQHLVSLDIGRISKETRQKLAEAFGRANFRVRFSQTMHPLNGKRIGTSIKLYSGDILLQSAMEEFAKSRGIEMKRIGAVTPKHGKRLKTARNPSRRLP